MNRRDFLRTLTASGTGLVVTSTLPGIAGFAPAPRPSPRLRDVTAADEVFPQGVISADPTPTGALVWTRVLPEAVESGMAVHLDVGTTPDMRAPVVSIDVASDELRPEHDHTLRVDLDRQLEPGGTYWFQWSHAGAATRPARLRTLPAPGTMPDRLRVALVGCQDYTYGHFNAYRAIADDDVDYILHMGDMTYETTSGPTRPIELPSGQGTAQGLRDFRTIWRTYHSDPAWKAARERHTLIAIWDDHEVANDRYWDPEEDRPRAPDHNLDGDPAASGRLHREGVQAWVEFVPTRAPYRPDGRTLREVIAPQRSIRFGDLAHLWLTDERLYKSPHPCGEGFAGERYYVNEELCGSGQLDDPTRTMLGAAQKQWLLRGLTTSDAAWKLWGSPIPTSPISWGVGPATTHWNLDAWGGYRAERAEINQALFDAGVRDVAILTGDMHAGMAATTHVGYGDAIEQLGPATGVELMTSTVSSIPIVTLMGGLTQEQFMLANNPHMAFWTGTDQGYGIAEFTPDGGLWTSLGVQAAVEQTNPLVRELASFEIPRGVARLDRA